MIEIVDVKEDRTQVDTYFEQISFLVDEYHEAHLGEMSVDDYIDFADSMAILLTDLKENWKMITEAH
mgnify:CR=1 FL=1